MSRKTMEDCMEKLSPEMIKTICDAITQEFYSWELRKDNDG
jgi:hypothetical protein